MAAAASGGTRLWHLLAILIVAAYIVVVPGLLEQALAARGIDTGGTNRILATGALFIGWAVLAVLLLAATREGPVDIGLGRPKLILFTLIGGLFLAALVFAFVVVLEQLGFGADRLGDMGSELRGNPALLLERMALSILIVGFVEELIFRGFLLTRLLHLFGSGELGILLALVAQAGLFGLAHAYQGEFGMILTGVLGLVFGVVFLATNRNLWLVIIGHGAYDAAHALYLAQT